MSKDFYRLIFITHKNQTPLSVYLHWLEEGLSAGITCIQLREKSMDPKERRVFAQALKELLAPWSIPLILNDEVELCADIQADGVHLGQSDMDVREARAYLGSQALMGLSVENLAHIHQATSLPVEYLGIGAIFPTSSKPNVASVWGLKGLKQAATVSSLPLVAIGGIEEGNVASVMEAGAKGVAAIGAFHRSGPLSSLLQPFNQILSFPRGSPEEPSQCPFDAPHF